MNTQKQISDRWWNSVSVIQTISIVQYVVKGIAKISIGSAIASPMIKGDGFHNLSDIVQALLVTIGVKIKNRKVNGYPFQLKEIETGLTLGVGLVLGWTAIFSIGVDSLVGLIAQLPRLDETLRAYLPMPAYHPVRVTRTLLVPLSALMATSVAISFVTSFLQVRVGTLRGEPAVVADGKETRADAVVELVALTGVILVQLLGWRWAEHALGLVVAGFVLHTAFEIGKPGLDSFLKRSLGETEEEELRLRVFCIPGVAHVTNLTTFRVGRGLAVCTLTVETRLEATRHYGLRFAIEHAVNTILRDINDVQETRIHLTLEEPPNKTERIAYACIRHDGDYRIVTDTEEATHLLIVDLVQDDPAKSRCRPHPIEGDIHAFCQHKHVGSLNFYGGRDGSLRRAPLAHGHFIHFTNSDNPEVELGVSLNH